MKKLCLVLAALLCALALSPAALAAEEFPELTPGSFPNVFALFEYLEQNGYPDYFGGMVSTDGTADHLTVLLVTDDDSIMEQIRAALVDDSGLSFAQAAYSYNAMRAIQDEISENYMGGESKIYILGVGLTSTGETGKGVGPSGKEMRVCVMVDESVFAEWEAKFSALYGDMVVVEVSTPPQTAAGEVVVAWPNYKTAIEPLIGDLILPPLLRPYRDLTLPLMFCLLVLAGCGILWFRRAHLIAAAQTADGAVVAKRKPMRRKEIESAVKNSAAIPSAALLTRITNALEDKA